MKLRRTAALALVGWYLMVPSGIHAQSQLAAPAAAPRGNDTLEIPVVVQPNQPPLDPTFVGDWCGYELFESFDETPPVEDTPPVHIPSPGTPVRQGQRCNAFRRGGNGVVFGGALFIDDPSTGLQVVSQSADAVSAREISVTRILEGTVRFAANPETTILMVATMTSNFKLDVANSFSRSHCIH